MARINGFDWPTYRDLRTDREQAEEFIKGVFEIFVQNGFVNWMLDELARESADPSDPEEPDKPYPAQGLRFTGREGFGQEEPAREMISDDLQKRSILAWFYYLFLNNHPDRLEHLFETSLQRFEPPKKHRNTLFSQARKERKAITIADLALEPGGSNRKRRSRNNLHEAGPFVSYNHSEKGFIARVRNLFRKEKPRKGREQARGIFAVGANPEITGSPIALATAVMSHYLACIPRDGLFQTVVRQVDLAKQTIKWIERSPTYYGKSEDEKEKLQDFYVHNLVGVVEPDQKKAEVRTRALYEAGIRTFRIYSPEPGDDILYTLKRLRQIEKEEGWEPIEIFIGQVVDVQQALALEAAGADAIYIGIGGGGRCTTGVVAGLTINWVQLVWDLRGKINIPVIVEGGANDNIGPSIASGVSGIGVVGKLAGTIETPGGFSFFQDADGNLIVLYGGEASDRMRAFAERYGPFGIIQNTEGGSTEKHLKSDENTIPTMLQVFDILNQGLVGSFVFQNVDSVAEMQNVGAMRLVLGAINDAYSRNTH
ncbi:MAG: IMP dehydrogenase [Patescibacteria group bacterium]